MTIDNNEGASGRVLPYDFVDFHTHFFPRRWFDSIWKFFEDNNWRINYKHDPEVLADMLREFGVSHFAILNYLHREGSRDELAEWTRDFAAGQPGAVPFGTVLPGENGNLEAARRWFDEWGFMGIKMQPLVSKMPIDHEDMIPIYKMMAEKGKWFVVHVGTAPYPNEFTHLDFLESVLSKVPDLPVILAHMGGYDYAGALDMMKRYKSLYLDTTMIFVNTNVFNSAYPLPVERLLEFDDRIVFGSDFPSIPYNYPEAVNGLHAQGMPDDFYKKVFRENGLRIIAADRGKKF